jgi:hypothetical protein
VTKKPDHRGEYEVSRKTIARGMPGVSGVTVVTNARAYYQYTRGCGRTRRPAFPAPSEARAERAEPNSGGSRCENAKCCLKIEFVFFSPPSARVSAWRGGVGGGGSIGQFADSRIRCATPHPLSLPAASRGEGKFNGGPRRNGLLRFARNDETHCDNSTRQIRHQPLPPARTKC